MMMLTRFHNLLRSINREEIYAQVYEATSG